MTDSIKKVGIPPLIGPNEREVIGRLHEAVDMLQGAGADAQRAVRKAEYDLADQRIAALEARLAAAGL